MFMYISTFHDLMVALVAIYAVITIIVGSTRYDDHVYFLLAISYFILLFLGY